MGSQMIQIIILAGVALFLILRLRNVLGTREGFEKPREVPDRNASVANDRTFDVIEGGGVECHRLSSVGARPQHECCGKDNEQK